MASNDEVTLSYAVITWEINNISLFLCSPKETLESTKFSISGPIGSSWNLSVETLQEKNEMVLYLEMRKISCGVYTSLDRWETELKISFIADILDANGEHAWAAERESRIRLNNRLRLETFELSEVRKVIPQQGPDSLTIRCYLLVHFGMELARNRMQSQVCPGITNMSNDFLRLVKEELYSDIKFMLGEKHFHLHKDMLLKRGSGLATLIMSRSKKDVIRLLNYEAKSLTAIFQYLYSGDLKYLYEEPKILIYDIVERWKIPELKYSYPKENIKFETIVEGNEYIFKWDIENFDDLGHSLSGPELYRDCMESCWQIHVHPKGLVHTNHQQNFVFFEASLLKSRKTYPLKVCIEFTCVNEQNSTVYAKRIQESMKPGDRCSVEFFLRGGTLMKRCLVKKTLLLRITFRIATGQVTSAVPAHRLPLPFGLDNTQSMMQFSKSMKSVLENPLNPDVTVCNGIKGFKAHRFVLRVRSTVLNSLLNAEDPIVSLPTASNLGLSSFLEYLYTGLIKQDNSPATDALILLELREIGTAFTLRALADMCYRLLDITPENVICILEFAHERKLAELKTDAIQMIYNIGPSVVRQGAWDLFKQKYPELAEDVIEYFNDKASPKKARRCNEP